MTDPVKIPFGYKRVHGHSQKGDGRWNAATGKFEKVKKEYPFIRDEQVVIRRCETVQAELAEVVETTITPQDVANLFAADAKRLCEQANAAMDEAQSELIERMASGVPTMDLD